MVVVIVVVVVTVSACKVALERKGQEQPQQKTGKVAKWQGREVMRPTMTKSIKTTSKVLPAASLSLTASTALSPSAACSHTCPADLSRLTSILRFSCESSTTRIW